MREFCSYGSGVPREQEDFARNCRKDGGGPSGDDFQKWSSNHRKLR